MVNSKHQPTTATCSRCQNIFQRNGIVAVMDVDHVGVGIPNEPTKRTTRVNCVTSGGIEYLVACLCADALLAAPFQQLSPRGAVRENRTDGAACARELARYSAYYTFHTPYVLCCTEQQNLHIAKQFGVKFFAPRRLANRSAHPQASGMMTTSHGSCGQLAIGAQVRMAIAGHLIVLW